MPAKPMQEALGAVGHTALTEEEVETLARRFAVSTHGMMIRLSRMGMM